MFTARHEAVYYDPTPYPRTQPTTRPTRTRTHTIYPYSPETVCIRMAVSSVRKMRQVLPWAMFDLCWKLQENPFICFLFNVVNRHKFALKKRNWIMHAVHNVERSFQPDKHISVTSDCDKWLIAVNFANLMRLCLSLATYKQRCIYQIIGTVLLLDNCVLLYNTSYIDSLGLKCRRNQQRRKSTTASYK